MNSISSRVWRFTFILLEAVNITMLLPQVLDLHVSADVFACLGSVHSGTLISAYGKGSTLIKLVLGCGQLQIPLVASVSTFNKT